ncbi:MAG: nucleotide exchange factor GrpE [Candidatus Nanopelagicales bacterium]|nr:nucleotide exchange factor GrpE [Candidatus Nanopelagicales bacterium]
MSDPHEEQPHAGGTPPAGGGPDPEQPQPAEPPQPEPDVADAEVVDVSEPEAADAGAEQAADAVEGEIVEPGGADELLAEALDADAVEAQFQAAEADAAAAAGDAGVAAAQVAALTADLQRVHAEYQNYRKRVERDRELVRDRAVEAVLAELLPILDDIGRAREHGELVGGFRSVGEALEGVLTRVGLHAFGAEGEPFDPTRHEALMREAREGVTEPTVVTVLQAGYEFKGRVVRPARVSVAGTD